MESHRLFFVEFFPLCYFHILLTQLRSFVVMIYHHYNQCRFYNLHYQEYIYVHTSHKLVAVHPKPCSQALYFANNFSIISWKVSSFLPREASLSRVSFSIDIVVSDMIGMIPIYNIKNIRLVRKLRMKK